MGPAGTERSAHEFLNDLLAAWFLISLARIELRKRREDKHPTD